MFESIFTDLISRHGGDGAFTSATLAVARTLAGLLANPTTDPVTARTMCELERLLPTPAAGDGAGDLSKLDDDELAFLDRVRKKLYGDMPVDVSALSQAQRAEMAELRERELEIERDRDRREDSLRADRDRLEAQVHELLIRVEELSRRAPGVAAGGDPTLPAITGADGAYEHW
jgi:hypothetical protein